MVDAAQNSLLSHVSALIRVALEAADVPSTVTPRTPPARPRRCGPSLAEAIRAGDAAASEEAMRALVELDWQTNDPEEERDD